MPELNQDTFRRQVSDITEEQRMAVDQVKAKAEELLALFDAATPLPGVNGVVGRCLATAKTNLEQAIMWAVKGITS